MTKRPLVEAPPEPSPQRSASQHIVESIVAAAIELGADATLATIADRAGVGSASLHRYFPTLSSIFAEVSRRMFRRLLGEIRGALADRDRELREIVRHICQIAFAGSDSAVSIAYRRRMNLEIPLAWSQETAEQAYQEIIEEVSAWLSTHLVEPPPEITGRVFLAFACIRGAVSFLILYPSCAPATDVLIERTTDAALAALLGDGNRALKKAE